VLKDTRRKTGKYVLRLLLLNKLYEKGHENLDEVFISGPDGGKKSERYYCLLEGRDGSNALLEIGYGGFRIVATDDRLAGMDSEEIIKVVEDLGKDEKGVKLILSKKLSVKFESKI